MLAVPGSDDHQIEILAAGVNLPAAGRGELDNKLVMLWLHGKAANTVLAYRADIDRFSRHVRFKPFEAVTLEDLQSFAGSLADFSPAAQARKLNAVKSLLTFGKRTGVLRIDVGEALAVPKLKNRLAERILAEGEIQRMLALEANPRNHALLRLLYQTGLRVSEARSLCWRDLSPNKDGGQANVFGKGAKTRVVLIQKNLWRIVRALRGDAGSEAPVFRSRKGAALDASMINRIVKAAAARAGVTHAASPHWFRHAHASHALDRGAPVHLVQQTLGHASLETTSKYVHARPGESSGNYLPD
jgi:integrase/recombinase XerD